MEANWEVEEGTYLVSLSLTSLIARSCPWRRSDTLQLNRCRPRRPVDNLTPAERQQRENKSMYMLSTTCLLKTKTKKKKTDSISLAPRDIYGELRALKEVSEASLRYLPASVRVTVTLCGSEQCEQLGLSSEVLTEIKV